MDFGKLLSRAWEMLWKNAFLILLGAVAALGGAGNGGTGTSRFAFQGNDLRWGEMPRFDFSGPIQGWDLPGLAVGGIALFVLAALLVGLLFWAVGTIARGALVSAVDNLEAGRPADFMTAFRAGWEKGWQLLGIGLIPAIPAFVLLAFTIGTVALSGGLEWLGQSHLVQDGFSAFAPLLVLACLLVPVGIILSLLQTFANRACMLEGTGVMASYQRGIEVLGANLGSAVLLFLLQIALGIGVGILMFIPSILSALCCLLWPLLILIQGTVTAYFSSLWTLAWREWVGEAAPAS